MENVKKYVIGHVKNVKDDNIDKERSILGGGM